MGSIASSEHNFGHICNLTSIAHGKLTRERPRVLCARYTLNGGLRFVQLVLVAFKFQVSLSFYTKQKLSNSSSFVGFFFHTHTRARTYCRARMPVCATCTRTTNKSEIIFFRRHEDAHNFLAEQLFVWLPLDRLTCAALICPFGPFGEARS